METEVRDSLGLKTFSVIFRSCLLLPKIISNRFWNFRSTFESTLSCQSKKSLCCAKVIFTQCVGNRNRTRSMQNLRSIYYFVCDAVFSLHSKDMRAYLNCYCNFLIRLVYATLYCKSYAFGLVLLGCIIPMYRLRLHRHFSGF